LKKYIGEPMLYSIEISGNGAEVGIHKLTKAQYDFWTAEKNKEFLKWAICEDYSGIDQSSPEEVYFSDSYIGLCNVDRLGGGYLGGLMIEISPIEFDNEDDENDESIYSFDDELNEFVESLSKPQYRTIVGVEEYEFPVKKGKTPGYLIWKSEESGMYLQGEFDVGKKFDLKKLRLNFQKVNEDIFLVGASYDEYGLEPTDNWDASGFIEVDIIKA
jgi:hypothetical protein